MRVWVQEDFVILGWHADMLQVVTVAAMEWDKLKKKKNACSEPGSCRNHYSEKIGGEVETTAVRLLYEVGYCINRCMTTI
jgi:hypothetical protein